MQADTAMARARTRDAAWLSHVHTEDKPVEWTGFNTYLDRQEASTSTKKQRHWWHLGHFSMRHLPTLTRSWRHSSTWKKHLEYLWNAICTQLGRPTSLPDIVYCAMERPLPHEISGVASQDDVVSWVHRDADEGIRRGCAAHCSLRGELLALSHESHPMHRVPTVSSPQCCSRISSRVEPRRTRS